MDKPEGFTSFDVVAKLRGICSTRKIGHGGTLDPMATGVLPVFVGPAVKAVDLAPRQDKTYEASILFGLQTDTGDITGEVLRRTEAHIKEEPLRGALASLLGKQQQTPPMYSAVKVDGKPLYKYAREGREVQRKARDITIHSFELLRREDKNRFTVRVHCSKGTYIRTLAEQLGEALGVPATLAALRRTGAGEFSIEEAHTLAAIQAAKDEGRLVRLFLPVERVFHALPEVRVASEAEKRLLNGAVTGGVRGTEGRCRVYAGERFLGLGALGKDGTLRAEKLFVERGPNVGGGTPV